MIKLYSRPTRYGVMESLQLAESEITVACPYVRQMEMRWFLDQLNQKKASRVSVKLITDIRLTSILSGSLEIEALIDLLMDHQTHRLVNLPRIHAKVFIADSKFAFVSSGNLTGGGLDKNYEYGVGIEDENLSAQIRKDILSYALIGNEVSVETVNKLKEGVEELRPKYEAGQMATNAAIKKELGFKLRNTNTEFIKAQIGERSPHAVFSEVVKFVLRKQPMTTPELHLAVKDLLPDICDDELELVINGRPFGKKWKHQIRTVQAHLKKQNVLELDGKIWKMKKK